MEKCCRNPQRKITGKPNFLKLNFDKAEKPLDKQI